MKTRSALHTTHLLQTPDTFVRTPMPGLVGGLAIIHAAPALGANFLQYTAELDPAGTLSGSAYQRFVYVLSGDATLTLEQENSSVDAPHTHALRPGSFVYLPTAHPASLRANSAARLAVIEDRDSIFPDIDPSFWALGAHDNRAHPQPFASDSDSALANPKLIGHLPESGVALQGETPNPETSSS